jgi:hypothetical protein
LTYFTASATVLYIFQFPQTKGIFMAICNSECRHYMI